MTVLAKRIADICSFLLIIVLSVLVANANTKSVTTRARPLKPFQKVLTTRAVVGSVADTSVWYGRDTLTTVTSILEFTTGAFSPEAVPVRLHLCGDVGQLLGWQILHTNVTLIYDLASPNKQTDCMRLVSISPWEENTEVQDIYMTSGGRKLKIRLDKVVKRVPGRIHAD